MPTNKWGKKALQEFDIPGYHKKYVDAAQSNLNVLAKCIEDYKLKFGTYPNHLTDIKGVELSLLDMDMSYRKRYPNGEVNYIRFYYAKVDSNEYYLAGAGKDGKFITKDDLLPQISIEEKKNTGLTFYKIKSFSKEEIKYEKQLLNMSKNALIMERYDKDKNRSPLHRLSQFRKMYHELNSDKK